MKPDDPRHGTCAGYQRHKKDGEEACSSCRMALRNYMRRRREDPVKRRRDAEGSNAGTRAAWRLVDAHRAEYERYYAEELTALRAVS